MTTTEPQTVVALSPRQYRKRTTHQRREQLATERRATYEALSPEGKRRHNLIVAAVVATVIAAVVAMWIAGTAMAKPDPMDMSCTELYSAQVKALHAGDSTSASANMRAIKAKGC